MSVTTTKDMRTILGHTRKQKYCRALTQAYFLSLLLMLTPGCRTLALNIDPCFNPESCQLQKCCELQGRCAHNGKRCAPRTNEDCRQSFYCKSDGRCQALSVLKTTHTRVFSDTIYEMIDRERINQCVAGSHADCAQSQGCKSSGRCGYAVDRTASDFLSYITCAPTRPEHCAQSDECKLQGLNCAYRDALDFQGQTKEARSQAALKRAFGTGKFAPPGRCTNESSAACRRSQACVAGGRCEMSKITNACFAANDADCAASTDCQKEGDCSKGSMFCEPSTNAHCRQSEECKSTGRCTYERGDCIATKDADCRASSGCKSIGACAAVSMEHMPGKLCLGASNEDCRAAEACKTKGTCHYEAGRYCLVSIDSCNASEECKSAGKCTPSKNRNECVGSQ